MKLALAAQMIVIVLAIALTLACAGDCVPTDNSGAPMSPKSPLRSRVALRGNSPDRVRWSSSPQVPEGTPDHDSFVSTVSSARRMRDRFEARWMIPLSSKARLWSRAGAAATGHVLAAEGLGRLSKPGYSA